MEKILNIRHSAFLLDRVFNPAQDPHIGTATPANLAEACGIIPDFFCQACTDAEPLPLAALAGGMDAAYQFGGFCYPFHGTVDDHNGIYKSHDGDPDLAPLARFIFKGTRFECFVYPYGITAMRDRATRETKVARFD